MMPPIWQLLWQIVTQASTLVQLAIIVAIIGFVLTFDGIFFRRAVKQIRIDEELARQDREARQFEAFKRPSVPTNRMMCEGQLPR